MVYVSPGCFAHPAPRAFWLGGGCEDARGIGSVGDGIGEGPCTRYAHTNAHACSLRVYETGACLTNCMIIGVTSEQAHSWFPAYFSVEAKRRSVFSLPPSPLSVHPSFGGRARQGRDGALAYTLAYTLDY